MTKLITAWGNWQLTPPKPDIEENCRWISSDLQVECKGVNIIRPNNVLTLKTPIGHVILPNNTLVKLFLTHPVVWWKTFWGKEMAYIESFMLSHIYHVQIDEQTSMAYVRIGLGFHGQKPALDTLSCSLFRLLFRRALTKPDLQDTEIFQACEAILNMWRTGNVLLGYDENQLAICLCAP